MGRWESARDLLEATGQDWDRRIFRLQVLAYGAARLRWVETWANTERNNTDALMMLAHVLAVRCILLGRQAEATLVEEAWQATERAAWARAKDPSAWVLMMALVRTHRPDRAALMEAWGEVRARDPNNREGHHELLAYVFSRNHGSEAEMHNYARELATLAPKGTPIPVVLLVAHAESHHLRRERESQTYGLTVHPWRDCPDIDRVLDDWWRHRSPRPHAQFMEDANYLAHALSYAGRHEEAFEVFEEIGGYATRLPWAYCGDPVRLFLTHRDWARRAVGSSV